MNKTLINQLQQAKLKITPQRLVILKVLQNDYSHPTADQIWQKAKQQQPHLSFDTVNRTLLNLTKMGLINMIESPDSARRFDAQINPHHHFYCQQCHQIIDFQDPFYDNLPLPTTLPPDFQLADIRIIVNGLCQKCQK